ncbi:MAG: hydantoinase/oxoprolinase N-terminal domain-containing protein, partial [Promethearchaeota archaeon]
MRAAIDIGGTFTDVLLYNENNGELWSAKVPSNREQPDNSFMDALLRVLRDSNMEIKQLTELVHGTTIATNALLEGKIAKVGLLVTEGFRDILEIGRQQRPHLYDLMVDRLPPLVLRNLVKEVRERIDADGNIVVPLDE